MGCTRADLPPVEWDVDEQLLRKHLGRVRRAGEAPSGEGDPDRLPEDPADGCPGGDQRSYFVQSLLAFGYRRRDGHGNRIANLRLDRCEDELVLDAIAYFEMEEAACSAFINEELLRKMERERNDGA